MFDGLKDKEPKARLPLQNQVVCSVLHGPGLLSGRGMWADSAPLQCTLGQGFVPTRILLVSSEPPGTQVQESVSAGGIGKRVASASHSIAPPALQRAGVVPESQVEGLGVNSSCTPGLRGQSMLIVCLSGLLLLMYPSLRHGRNHATLSSSKAFSSS